MLQCLIDNFIQLGGDSILVMDLLRELEKSFPDQLSMSNIFTYNTVSEISKHLDKKLNKKEEKIKVIESEEGIDSILDQLSRGDISEDKATAKLLNID